MQVPHLMRESLLAPDKGTSMARGILSQGCGCCSDSHGVVSLSDDPQLLPCKPSHEASLAGIPPWAAHRSLPAQQLQGGQRQRQCLQEMASCGMVPPKDRPLFLPSYFRPWASNKNNCYACAHVSAAHLVSSLYVVSLCFSQLGQEVKTGRPPLDGYTRVRKLPVSVTMTSTRGLHV